MFSLERNIGITMRGAERERKNFQICKEIDGRKVRLGYVGKKPGSPVNIIRRDLLSSGDIEDIEALCVEMHGQQPSKVSIVPAVGEDQESRAKDLSEYE